MAGTTPAGAQTEEQASRWVKQMFAGVVGRYDLLNTILSFNIDALWRKRTVSRLRSLLQPPDSAVLDLCCGTGALLRELEKAAGRKLYGSDFCHPMLEAARERGHVLLFEADALHMPLADASLDLITVAFGVRNFANYRQGFREMARALKPGGTAAILEFSRPPNMVFRGLYEFYSLKILPRVGALISGSREAYRYLPESVRKFPNAEDLASVLKECGFSTVEFERMTMGIVALHLARK